MTGVLGGPNDWRLLHHRRGHHVGLHLGVGCVACPDWLAAMEVRQLPFNWEASAGGLPSGYRLIVTSGGDFF